MCSRLEVCRWINSNSQMIRNILFNGEAHFTRDGVNIIQETLFYGIVISLMELSEVATNISLPQACGVVSLVTN